MPARLIQDQTAPAPRPWDGCVGRQHNAHDGGHGQHESVQEGGPPPAADQKALREMELFKAELLATVSHELRSPLASVKGYAATLLRHERRSSREMRHEFLLAIKEASDRLEAVIDRLLEISLLETGGITIGCSCVNLAYLVGEAITSVEHGGMI